MSDVASLICWECSLVLPLGYFQYSANPRRLFTDSGPGRSDTLATAAVWKFLGEHVYHEVELAGEQSEAWERIDEDYTRIDGDLVGAPSLRAYAEDSWEGRALALQPRPLCQSMRSMISRLEQCRSAGSWIGSSLELPAVNALLEVTEWPPPGDRLGDDEVVRRLSGIRDGCEAMAEMAAGFEPQATLRQTLADVIDLVRPVLEIPLDELMEGRGSYAPGSLFDAERALGLFGKFLGDMRFSLQR